MKDILENVTIIHRNGSREICDAISITENGVYLGEIKKTNDKEDFINYGFIPKDQILKIIFFDINGDARDIDFTDKKIGGRKKWTEK